jgi:hypothetical protein
LDANEDILSFGPHFGQEAVDEGVRRLEALGLSYVEDFFVFIADLPDWCRLGVALRSDEETDCNDDD